MARIILLSILFTLIGCGEEKRTSLNVEERKEVNQQYKDVLDSLNKSLIAECDNNRNKKLNDLVDSLKKARLEEILLITKSNKNEQ